MNLYLAILVLMCGGSGLGWALWWPARHDLSFDSRMGWGLCGVLWLAVCLGFAIAILNR